MLKRFNQQLRGKNRRCVLLIMPPSDVDSATLYIYEPVHHNSVPPEISCFTEIAHMLNTKSDFLPGRSIHSTNGLCVSIHSHGITVDGEARIERAYMTDGVRSVRVFKHNLKATLIQFGLDEEDYVTDIERENNLEFNDPQYLQFVDSLFTELDIAATIQ